MKDIILLIQNFSLRFKFWYILLFLYLLVFVRQYTWPLNNMVAWAISFLLTFVLTTLIIQKVYNEEKRKNPINLKFCLIVGLPLSFFYLFRFAFPDGSFDIINYHFITSERALRGYPFMEGDFLYLMFSNPVGDMLSGLFRHSFGHRVGTILNLFVLFWSASILDKILRPYFQKDNLRYLLIFFTLSSEGIIYQISNYWVDLLAFPLLLEIIYFLVFQKNRTNYHFMLIALFMGMSVAFKLTNLYFVVPAIFIFSFVYFNNNRKMQISSFTPILAFVGIFFLPLIPFHLYIFSETGNPIYPHFNSIFKSPLWSLQDSFDLTLGPENSFERIFWPIVMLFKSERLSSLPMAPIATTIGYILSLFGILSFIFKREWLTKEIQYLSFITFSFIAFWSHISGDFRYVVILEVFSCILILMYVYHFAKLKNIKITKSLSLSFITFFCVLLFTAKFIISLPFIDKYEWGTRPSFKSDTRAYIKELKYVFRDYSLYNFLSPESKKVIDKAEVWLPSSPLVSGYKVLLNPDIPYTDLHHLPTRGEKGDELFSNTIESLGNKRFFSIIKAGTLGKTLEWSLDEIKKQGFELISLQKINIPYFSHSAGYNYEFQIVEAVPFKFRSHLVERIGKEKHAENHLRKNMNIPHSMQEDSKDLIIKLGEEEIKKQKQSLIVINWTNGFSILERHGNAAWRWSSDKSTFTITNKSNVTIESSITLDFVSGYSELSKLEIHGDDFSDLIYISSKGKHYSKSIKIEAGKSYTFKLKSHAKQVEAPGDPRSLFFKVINFNNVNAVTTK